MVVPVLAEMVTEGVTFEVMVTVSQSLTVAVQLLPSVTDVMQKLVVAAGETVICELALVKPVCGQVIPAPVPLTDQLGVPVNAKSNTA